MIKLPYIKIEQLDDYIISTSMSARYLIEHVHFEYRSPYISDKSLADDTWNLEKYKKRLLNQLESENVSINSSPNSIQRRTDIKRISEIGNFINKSSGILFPTPIVLAVNLRNINTEKKSPYKLLPEEKCMEIESDAILTVIDGQHRLLGIEASNPDRWDKINLPVIIIPNADISVSTKIFIDINSNQRKVNKSTVYDLFPNIKLSGYNAIGLLSQVIHLLNERDTSPLYSRIKTLGTGVGSISQGFLIDYLNGCLGAENDPRASDNPEAFVAYYYQLLFQYFKIVKNIFPTDWQNEKSSICKTNGIGALIKLLPLLINSYGQIHDAEYSYSDFFIRVKNQHPDIWVHGNEIGTGYKAQNELFQMLQAVL